MSWQDKRLVIVEWLDACCDNSWQSMGAKFTPTKCWTLGLLAQDDEDAVAVLGTISEAGEFNQVMTIPKAMVVSIQDIEWQKPSNVVQLPAVE